MEICQVEVLPVLTRVEKNILKASTAFCPKWYSVIYRYKMPLFVWNIEQLCTVKV